MWESGARTGVWVQGDGAPEGANTTHPVQLLSLIEKKSISWSEHRRDFVPSPVVVGPNYGWLYSGHLWNRARCKVAVERDSREQLY